MLKMSLCRPHKVSKLFFFLDCDRYLLSHTPEANMSDNFLDKTEVDSISIFPGELQDIVLIIFQEQNISGISFCL